MAHTSIDTGEDVDPYERDLANSPSVLAGEVQKSLKRVVQETAWTIKRRQQANAIGFDIVKEPGELHKVQQACLQYVQSVGALRTWLMHAQAALLDELQTATEREARDTRKAQEKAAEEAAKTSKAQAKDEASIDETSAQSAVPKSTGKQPEGISTSGKGDTGMIGLTMECSPEASAIAAMTSSADTATLTSDARANQEPVALDAPAATAVIASNLPTSTPSVDATAIIQQIINNMPSSTDATSAPSSNLPDLTAFGFGDFGLGSSSSFDPGALDMQNFNFDGMDFGSSVDDGSGGVNGRPGSLGDLSSLDFSNLGGPPSATAAEFDLTSMIQSFDQATSRNQ
ncbi:hypothetical protein K437DRAFT_255190 [Tilletiaria anomala UBC 951]|uniref:Uncharacterized protein n=1 Tax=Tilletiaria anomala (strain ATCC 24038 / CBS 436.72 / UBC 951) TaxID=1037660 RepID=A0A066W7K7_TILAU|nr:uncharacterized protein K437DRAFT_255190 [Tilletiaria anomala UBC 951]KDN49932.1 hypothetical protein K437DRAFT_255190 [Tilletiaria anomala UBC 951]